MVFNDFISKLAVLAVACKVFGDFKNKIICFSCSLQWLLLLFHSIINNNTINSNSNSNSNSSNSSIIAIIITVVITIVIITTIPLEIRAGGP